MKLQEFELAKVSWYDITQAVMKVYNHGALETIKDGEVSVEVEVVVHIKAPNNRDSVAIFNSLSKETQEKVDIILRQQHEDKIKATIQHFKDIVAKCDFVLKDSPEWERLKSLQDSVFACQFINQAETLLYRLLKSKRAKSVVYNARNLAYTSTQANCA